MAFVEKRFVDVAFVEVELMELRYESVEEAPTRIPSEVEVGVRYPETRFQLFPKLLPAARESVFAVKESPPPIVAPCTPPVAFVERS